MAQPSSSTRNWLGLTTSGAVGNEALHRNPGQVEDSAEAVHQGSLLGGLITFSTTPGHNKNLRERLSEARTTEVDMSRQWVAEAATA